MAMPILLSNVPIGFRFEPTDQELVVDYLQRRVAGQPCPLPIANIDIRKFNPCNLPSKAMPLFGGRQWYFFAMKDHRKYSKRPRPNRSAATGFWKVKGNGELISPQQNHGDVIVDLQPIAIKKVRVFHLGCPPTERKTPWVMHTYCLVGPIPLDCTIEWVLCKVFRDTKMILPPPPPPGPGPAEIQQLQDSMRGMMISNPSNIVMYPSLSSPTPKQAPDNYQELYHHHHHHHQMQINNDDVVDDEAISEVIIGGGGPMFAGRATMANSAASTSGATTVGTNHQEEEDGATDSEPRVIDNMVMDNSSFADLE